MAPDLQHANQRRSTLARRASERDFVTDPRLRFGLVYPRSRSGLASGHEESGRALRLRRVRAPARGGPAARSILAG